MTFAALARAFWAHALQHYRDTDGEVTSEIKCLRDALNDPVQLYGETAAVDFGPRALKALREKWIKKEFARTTINARVNRIRRVFKWAASEELIPVEVYTALATVEGLEKNRTKARETKPVLPVLDLHVAVTLTYLSPTIRAMVMVQRLTGMRPQDILQMRAGEIDRTVKPWVYEPPKHKTRYKGTVRRVMIAAAAQEILKPILDKLQPGDVVFCPRRAKVERYAAMRATRKSKVQPSQESRAKKPNQLERETPAMYTLATYEKSIRNACDKAGIPHWSPNRLRHTFGSEARQRFGLEAAQVLLGHTKANVTQVYAGRDLELAARAAEKMG
jgi:integrase